MHRQSTNNATHTSLHHDLNNFDINFFKQQKFPWNAHIAWANPPYLQKILLQTVQFFIKHHITGYFLTPTWTETQQWKLAKKNCQYIISLPINDKLFFPAHNNNTTSVGPTKWSVTLFIFSTSTPIDHIATYNYVKHTLNFNNKNIPPLTKHKNPTIPQINKTNNNQNKKSQKTNINNPHPKSQPASLT